MRTINNNIHQITAFAPATCANVAVGFDVLGFAFDEVGDYVTLTRRDDNKLVIDLINSDDALPFATHQNTASFVIQQLCEDLNLKVGFSIRITKGIPLCSGMGGSAASAVAALVAFNAFLDHPLTLHELAQYALLGEELASGQQHPDNIVPCLFGGLTLIHAFNPIEVVQLPIPDLYCVLIHPHLYIPTKEARRLLKDELPLKQYVKQSANLAAFIAALYSNNIALMEKSLIDVLIEPQRAQLIPGFYDIKQKALQAGAFGVSFSGSGPSLFAFAKDRGEAQAISDVMQSELKNFDIESDGWISPISKKGAVVTQSS